MRTVNLVAIVAFLIISLTLVVLAFLRLGSPATQAAIKRDVERAEYFMRVAAHIHAEANRTPGFKGLTPEIIQKGMDSADRSDHEGLTVEVRIINSKEFEVCTAFELSSDRWKKAGVRLRDPKFQPSAGRFCQTFSVKDAAPNEYIDYYY